MGAKIFLVIIGLILTALFIKWVLLVLAKEKSIFKSEVKHDMQEARTKTYRLSISELIKLANARLRAIRGISKKPE